MHFYGLRREKIGLVAADKEPASLALRDVLRNPRNVEIAHDAVRLARAVHRHFISPAETAPDRTLPRRAPSVFRDSKTGLLRLLYREIVIRFRAKLSARNRRAHLRDLGLEVVRRSEASPHIVFVRDPLDSRRGNDLVRIANRLAERDDEIVYAAPNFVSEYRRNAIPAIPVAQWHLNNTAYYPGQEAGQDIRAKDGWAIGMGSPNIIVAVLDDGVDVDHPAFASAIWRNPDASSPDKCGRDYTCAPSDPNFYNPRPKTFNPPFSDPDQNDIHGTACAGLVAAVAPDARAFGVAAGCRILPIKIFNAAAMVPDEMVANAVRYAAGIADVLSCSWDGPAAPQTSDAINYAASQGRGGKGCPVLCAVGNSGDDSVAFPATVAATVAVGSSTDDGNHASYSNTGPEVSLVTPSSGGMQRVFTCDVSLPQMGFNPGDDALGGADGLYTNSFGGTSASVPMAAGVAALLLTHRPDLTAAEIKGLLENSADKISDDLDAHGHSDVFGYGRLNLLSALKAAQSFGGHNND